MFKVLSQYVQKKISMEPFPKLQQQQTVLKQHSFISINKFLFCTLTLYVVPIKNLIVL